MQTDRLDNCSRCGRLFLKDHSDCCLDCFQKTEQEFKGVADFLKGPHNRYATIEDVSKFTGVSVKRIADFIRDGRVYAEDYPNLGYECAHCGKLIKRQVLCNDCYTQFSDDVNKALKREQLTERVSSAQTAGSTERTAQYWKLRKDK
jgi:flagellar operon protein (TIGR03826 family)